MDIVNVPNALTALRIAIIPFLSLLIIQGYPFYSLVLFILSASTDLLDGFFARKLNQKTAFGIIFDPLADKIFFLSLLIILAIKHLIPLWFATFIILRDLLIAGGSIFYLFNKKGYLVRPHITGKLVNLFLFIIILSKLMAYSNYIKPSNRGDNILYFISMCLSYTSLLVYVKRFLSFKKVGNL